MDSDEPPPLEIKSGEDPWDRYEVLEVLGEGGFGIIYKVKEMKTGEIFAAKVVDVGEDVEEVQKELDFINSCNHPNIIKAYDSCRYNNKIYIFLECCEAGSVYDILRVIKRDLTEEEISYIVKDSLEALVYLHKQEPVKCHRDMKNGNILISDKGNILLTDFGVSAEINKETRKEVTGSSYWMAPEIVKGQTYDERADIWSLGITCIEMAEGKPPLSHKNTLKAMYLIPRLRPPTLKNPERYSKQFNDFIAQCLTKDPNHRPSSSKLLFDPFIHSLFTKRKKKIEVMKNLVGEVFSEFGKFGGRKQYFQAKEEESLRSREEEEEGEVEFDEAWDDEEEGESEEEEDDDDNEDDDDSSSSDAEDYEKSKIYRRSEMKKIYTPQSQDGDNDEEDDYLADSDEDKELFDEEQKIGKLELSMSKKNLFEGMARRHGSIAQPRKPKKKKPKPPPPSKNKRPSLANQRRKKKKGRKSPKSRRKIFVRGGKRVMIPGSTSSTSTSLSLGRFKKICLWFNSILWIISALFIIIMPSVLKMKKDETLLFMRMYGVLELAVGISYLPIIKKYSVREGFLQLAIIRSICGIGIIINLLVSLQRSEGLDKKKKEGFFTNKLKGYIYGNDDDINNETSRIFASFVMISAIVNVLLGIVFWVMVIKGRKGKRKSINKTK